MTYLTGMMMVWYGYGDGIEKSLRICEMQNECEGNA
jgi:hypothetical protein